MRKVLLIALLIIFYSCKEEVHNTPSKPLSVEAKSAKEHSQQKPIRLEECTDSIAILEKETKLKLQQLTPADADVLYMEYTKSYYEHLSHVQVTEASLADNYYSWVKYDQKGNITQMPSFVKKKIGILDKAGMEIWDIGEGMTQIRPKADYFINIFGKYISPGLNEFLRLEAKDNRELWAADAGLMISWEELGKRVISWENFLKKYPDSKLKSEAEDTYTMYRNIFLTGLDNTPVFEYDSNEMIPEVKTAFESFVKTYPESPTTPLVEEVLGFKNGNEDLYPFAKKIDSKFGDP